MLRMTLLSLVLALLGFFFFSSEAHARSSSFAHLRAFSLPVGGTFHKLQQKGAFFQTPVSTAERLSSSAHGTLVQLQTQTGFFGGFAVLGVIITSIYAVICLSLIGANIWAILTPDRLARLAWGIIGAVLSLVPLLVGFLFLEVLTFFIFVLPSATLLGLSITSIVLGARMRSFLPVSVLPFVAPDPLGRPVSGLLFSGSF